MEGVERKFNGMVRSSRNSTHVLQNFFTRDAKGVLNPHSGCEFADGGGAGYARDTALGTEADLANEVFFYPGTECQNVSANGVLDLRGNRIAGHLTGATRILEMIEQLCGVHAGILEQRPLNAPRWPRFLAGTPHRVDEDVPVVDDA